MQDDEDTVNEKQPMHERRIRRERERKREARPSVIRIIRELNSRVFRHAFPIQRLLLPLRTSLSRACSILCLSPFPLFLLLLTRALRFVRLIQDTGSSGRYGGAEDGRADLHVVDTSSLRCSRHRRADVLRGWLFGWLSVCGFGGVRGGDGWSDLGGSDRLLGAKIDDDF
jgi:hypothetical protein